MTLDTGFFLSSTVADIQIFTTPATVTNTQWQTWRKPRGITMVHIFVLGGGGGGGSGFTRAVDAAGGGGGGGGSASQSSFLTPAYLLPDVLYTQTGAGGIGGSNGNGTTGIPSIISVYPGGTTNNLVISSVAGAGGTAGTSIAAGAAGAAGSASAIASMPFAGLGIFQAIAGRPGANGGVQTGAVGGSIALPSTGAVTTGGSGGAGVTSIDFAGGGFNAIANTLVSQCRPATSSAGFFDGSSGNTLWKPFFNFGGGGGSSSNSDNGGAGGYAAYGSGGGGGGAGITGGRGGNGGNGIIMIASW